MIRRRNTDAGQLEQRKMKIYYDFLEGGKFSEEMMEIH
jgi:hypothetical protein